ncbi:MAG: acyl carrier protein [Porphyromonadaceae bacterium]|nr:MAG: acyl carrier protein [Porphyromonadaceae bacterium]
MSATSTTPARKKPAKNWDSLHHLMLISELEDAFGVEFDPEEMAEMKTFAQVKSTLESKM